MASDLVGVLMFGWGLALEPASSVEPAETDKELYNRVCGVCHQVDGYGVPFMQPALVDSARLTGDAEWTLEIIFKGSSAIPEGVSEYDNQMPRFSGLKDEDIARIASYVRRAFGGQPDPVTLDAVRGYRQRQSGE